MHHQTNEAATKNVRTRRLAAGLIPLIVLCCGITTTDAAEDPAASTPIPSPEQSIRLNEQKQCTWACLKWTKLCNVDPRGVYKCRRTCADFGEVCE